MEVKQIASIMNEVTNEVLGTENIVAEDLSNLVDVGHAVENARAYKDYIYSLVDHIGRVTFVDRVYKGTAPSVLVDGWEYGSILEKITPDALPEAEENESWELEAGKSYDPHKFYGFAVSAKFWNRRVTFEVPISLPEKQIKESFSTPAQLNGFISMIQTAIQNTFTVKLDALVQRTVNKAIFDTVVDDFTNQGALVPFANASGIKAVNVLYLYNQKMTAKDSNWVNLTQTTCVDDPGFIRFTAYMLGLYKDRLTRMSTLFNIGAKERFTSPDRLHTILLSEFRRAADVYLQSETFHEEYTKLVDSETVPYWQGSGTDYSFGQTSSIKVTTGENQSVTISGILGVMFDRYALGVCNMDRRVTSEYNPKGEFHNEFYKMDAGYFVDGNENVVVFFAA